MKSTVGKLTFLDATHINLQARTQLFRKYHSTEQIQKLHHFTVHQVYNKRSKPKDMTDRFKITTAIMVE